MYERGDITRWREDMNFIFGCKTVFFERAQLVTYCFWYMKIKKFISSSRRVMFFLLYRQECFTGKYAEIPRILHGGAKIWVLFGKTIYFERAQGVKHWFWHEKIKFISSSRRVMFFLLYRLECFSRKYTEIPSSTKSRVRLWKINHSRPGCSFYEFYQWYIFQ